MNKKGQMATVFVAIFIVIAFGLVLYLEYSTIEAFRLYALTQSFATNPLIRMMLYGLQQLLWGAWFILGVLFVGATAQAGGV